ncbi:MAG TPA: OmpW family protein [Alphaproteobacteria bacterium]|nr:OmpW family protein [Alphaproteobacteria bacterium]
MKKLLSLLATTSILLSGAAMAGGNHTPAEANPDLSSVTPEGNSTSSGVLKKTNAGDWMVRLRALGVVPDESGTTSIGGKVSVDNAVIPELDITYFITNKIAAELVLGTAEHTVKANGTGAGDLNVTDTWILPPTLTIQYHPFDEGNFRPYVGAGLNYTIFYNEQVNTAAVGNARFDDAIGYALQAGVDYGISEHWALNFDVKKIFLETDLSLDRGAITARNVDLDPWLIGAGISYRF